MEERHGNEARAIELRNRGRQEVVWDAFPPTAPADVGVGVGATAATRDAGAGVGGIGGMGMNPVTSRILSPVKVWWDELVEAQGRGQRLRPKVLGEVQTETLRGDGDTESDSE